MAAPYHYVVTRLEHGWGNRSRQAPDRIQVMASSRTLAGAERVQRSRGGEIRRREGAWRRYVQNETIDTLY